jgi:hypothetical protein
MEIVSAFSGWIAFPHFLRGCRFRQPPNDYKVKAISFRMEKTMKFVCLGYYDDKKWAAMAEAEQKAYIEECFSYDDVLRKGGHIAGGEALDPPRNAATLRSKDGKIVVTDGPYAETQGTDRRHPDPRGQGPETCHRVDVEASGTAQRRLRNPRAG